MCGIQSRRDFGGLWLFLEKNSTCSKEKDSPLLRTSYKPISVWFHKKKKVKNIQCGRHKDIYIYIYIGTSLFWVWNRDTSYLLYGLTSWGPSQAVWGIGFNQERFKRNLASYSHGEHRGCK